MAVQVRCGICQEIFSIEAWAKECDCTVCGAHRAWTSASTFAWTKPGLDAPEPQSRGIGRLLGRRPQPVVATAVTQ